YPLLFFIAPAPTSLYTLSLHDALPISSLLKSSIFWRLFSANALSPTDSASSIIKISGLTLTETEKPNLDFIPLEYDFTGWSINFSNQENSIILCSNYFISSLLNHLIKSLSSILSLPVKSFFNPADTAIKDACPFTLISPEVSGTIPAIILDKVDFPEPFIPTKPITSPWLASKFTFVSA